MRCSDVIEVSMKNPRRHVGGTPKVNRRGIKMRRASNSYLQTVYFDWCMRLCSRLTALWRYINFVLLLLLLLFHSQQFASTHKFTALHHCDVVHLQQGGGHQSVDTYRDDRVGQKGSPIKRIINE